MLLTIKVFESGKERHTAFAPMYCKPAELEAFLEVVELEPNEDTGMSYLWLDDEECWPVAEEFGWQRIDDGPEFKGIYEKEELPF